MQLLIGADGRRWLPHGRDFVGAYGSTGSWREGLDRAVRSQGQVSLHISPRRYRIRLQPQALTWGAFQQLMSVLLDDEGKPVVLEMDGADPAELYGQVDDALARIDDLRAMNPVAVGPQWRASFLSERLSLERLKAAGWGALQAAYRRWARRRGQLDRPSLKRLLDAPLEAPLLLARIGRDGSPIAETWPGYLDLYDAADLPRVLGRRFEEHPLGNYGALAAEGYRAADRESAARLELIEAVVRPASGGTIRLRYDRLLLPWRMEDGTRYVTSLSRQIWRRASACPIC
jgi:hypothetical protein